MNVDKGQNANIFNVFSEFFVLNALNANIYVNSFKLFNQKRTQEFDTNK